LDGDPSSSPVLTKIDLAEVMPALPTKLVEQASDVGVVSPGSDLTVRLVAFQSNASPVTASASKSLSCLTSMTLMYRPRTPCHPLDNGERRPFGLGFQG
jgi:hypothetical protein